MKTIAEYEAISEEERLKILKEAKGGTWYDGWQPYCTTCSTIMRMKSENYGFSCDHCGNMIGYDLCRVVESPLNRTILNRTTV